jgi:hypothetical protein
MKFYYSTNGDGWRNKANWFFDSPLENRTVLPSIATPNYMRIIHQVSYNCDFYSHPSLSASTCRNPAARARTAADGTQGTKLHTNRLSDITSASYHPMHPYVSYFNYRQWLYLTYRLKTSKNNLSLAL